MHALSPLDYERDTSTVSAVSGWTCSVRLRSTRKSLLHLEPKGILSYGLSKNVAPTSGYLVAIHGMNCPHIKGTSVRVFFLLGVSSASEFYVPTFRNILSVPSS